jgi:hypothetical protein
VNINPVGDPLGGGANTLEGNDSAETPMTLICSQSVAPVARRLRRAAPSAAYKDFTSPKS